MVEYLFPVEYKANHHWDTEMIQEWKSSGKLYLTFAFNRFYPHTLPQDTFWMYLYYTKGSTDEVIYQGTTRYKFHVLDWGPERFQGVNTYYYKSTLDATVWFMCDQGQEIRRVDDDFLIYKDFLHPEGKNLASSLRTSIAPAICKVRTVIKCKFP